MFKGSIVALLTPFKNDKLDEENYANLIHHHLKMVQMVSFLPEQPVSHQLYLIMNIKK